MAAPSPQYTPEQVVGALNECGGMMFLAARKLGCSYKTIQRYKARHAVVREACEQKRGEMVDAAESALHRAILAGESWAVCFTLKTLGKSRGFVERQELRLLTDDDINQAITGELERLGRGRQASLPGTPQGHTDSGTGIQ